MSNICYLIGAMPSHGERFTALDKDLVIAADAGWKRAEQFGLEPQLAVGDFDTAPPPKEIPTITHPARKDDTDLMLAAKVGLERGYRTFVLLGVSGGRPDHAFAAYQTLHWLRDRGAVGYLYGDGMATTFLRRESVCLSLKEGTTFSLFAVGGNAAEVTIRGAAYPLEAFTLTPDFPLGISNRSTEAPLELSVSQGNLLCFVEGDPSVILLMEEGRRSYDNASNRRLRELGEKIDLQKEGY